MSDEPNFCSAPHVPGRYCETCKRTPDRVPASSEPRPGERDALKEAGDRLADQLRLSGESYADEEALAAWRGVTGDTK